MAIDWQKIKTEYITDPSASYRSLAEKYEVSYVQIGNVGKDENWVELRKQHLDNVLTKSLRADTRNKVNRAKRIRDAADLLLDKVEKAINELDLQMVTNKDKTKTIEYNNPQRADKPTKEVIHETEQIVSVSSIVDRKGLQQIAAALKDIMDIHGVQSELDRQEQKARIAKIQKDTTDKNDTTGGIEVVFENAEEDWNG